jgi:hypothetical protein
MATDTDGWLENLAAEIRAGSDDDPAARERIMDAVHAGKPGRSLADRWDRRFRQWLLRARPVAVSPLGWAAVFLVVIALSLGWLRHPSPPLPDTREMAGRAGPNGKWSTQFVVVAPTASSVTVVGDFNNWDPLGTPLERSGRDGMWTATLWLPAGVYSYNYLVDGRLQHAMDEPGLRDEFGGGHSIVIVGEGSL